MIGNASVIQGAGVPGQGMANPKGFFYGGKNYKWDDLTPDQQEAILGGVNPFDGSMLHPNYEGIDTGALKSSYDTINPNTQALDQFNQDALRTGPSRGALLAMEQNRSDALLGLDGVQRATQGANAQARSQLAMKGGMGGGAAERIAKSGRDQGVQGAQAVNANAAKINANIGMEDERSRMGNLTQANTMNQANAEFRMNKNNALQGALSNENTKKNAFNLGKYQTYMQAWGAGKQADATASAGKK